VPNFSQLTKVGTPTISKNKGTRDLK
jgi:hypothetical protein